MARTTGKRKIRAKYAVLGDGITEQWYLKHLKDYRNYRYSIKPSLFDDITFEKAEDIIDDLKNHIPNYKKKKSFLQQTEWFKLMVNEEKDRQAIKNATRLSKLRSRGGTQQHFPFTRMHIAITEFEKQKKK